GPGVLARPCRSAGAAWRVSGSPRGRPRPRPISGTIARKSRFRPPRRHGKWRSSRAARAGRIPRFPGLARRGIMRAMPARAPRAPSRPSVAPRAAIRRFDVFAEYHRLEASARGMAGDRAKGHGLGLAKIVAPREFVGVEGVAGKAGEHEGPAGAKWHVLGGKPQTAVLFDREIVSRMGPGFYRRVFAPAVRRAFDDGKRYVDIRDSLRATWKPQKPLKP